MTSIKPTNLSINVRTLAAYIDLPIEVWGVIDAEVKKDFQKRCLEMDKMLALAPIVRTYMNLGKNRDERVKACGLYDIQPRNVFLFHLIEYLDRISTILSCEERVGSTFKYCSREAYCEFLRKLLVPMFGSNPILSVI